jgi:S-adenosylmethionine synthetase
MPLTIDLANKMLLQLRECKESFIRPDAKSQITVEYRE